jgi:hypothetical protein
MWFPHHRMHLSCLLHLSANPVPPFHGLTHDSVERERGQFLIGITPLLPPNWSIGCRKGLRLLLVSEEAVLLSPSLLRLNSENARIASRVCPASAIPPLAAYATSLCGPSLRSKHPLALSKCSQSLPTLANPRKLYELDQESIALSPLPLCFSLNVLSISNRYGIQCNSNYHAYPLLFQPLNQDSAPKSL